MTQWICEVTAKPIVANSCIECARVRKRPGCPVAVPGILKALKRSLQEDTGLAAVKTVARIPVIRVTSLVGCVRKAWYDARLQRPLEKPSQMWSRLRGVIFHAGLENGDAGEELRLFARVETAQGEAIVAGRVDYYDEANRVLWDFKTINTWKSLANFDLPKPSHVRQLGVYRWLLAQNGMEVAKAHIAYITMGEMRHVEAELPDVREVEAEVREVVGQVVNTTPPPATPRETWECRYCPWVQCPAHPEHHSDDIEDDIFA